MFPEIKVVNVQEKNLIYSKIKVVKYEKKKTDIP